jgi:hypothetical protein
MIRQLFAEATTAQQTEFKIQANDDDWGFTLGLALLKATRPR